MALYYDLPVYREVYRLRMLLFERINGPVLLLSAGDDRMWPSARLCRFVEERLTRHRFAHAVIHHSYPEAGHIFPTPYVPTTNTTLVDTPGGEAKIAFGGTAEANYRAGVAAWHRTLEFLQSHV